MKQVNSADAKRAFEKIIAETDSAAWGLLIPQDGAASLGNDYPAIFPLTWLCRRLQDSQGATGWAQEFEAKTRLDPAEKLDPNAIAVQAFRERIAQRQYASLTEE
jgi:hypothetical protein